MRNKHYFILAALFLGNMISVQGQDQPAERKTQFGFKVIPNATFVKIKEGSVQNNGAGLGFAYGLVADHNFSPNYYLSFEALVTSLRNRITLKDSFYQGDGSVGAVYRDIQQDYRLQYLQSPVSLKMKTNSINGMKYVFQVGLAPGFLLSRKVRVSASPSLSKEDEWFSPNESEKDKGDFQANPNDAESTGFSNNIGLFRVPLIIGAGIEYKLSGNTAFTAGLRWDNAFTDIFRDKQTNGVNNYLGLTVGVLF